MRTNKFDWKGKKVGGAAKLYGQIDRLIGAVEGKSTMRQLVIGTSIPEVVQVVEPLPGCERTSPLWLFAARLFFNQEKREMFSIIKYPSVQLTRLNYEFINQ